MALYRVGLDPIGVDRMEEFTAALFGKDDASHITESIRESAEEAAEVWYQTCAPSATKWHRSGLGPVH